jgi:predicted TIM-barrel fold metal-dependent hydrolase
MFDLSGVILIDHHAHSLLSEYANLDAIGFRQAFSETRSMRVLEQHIVSAIPYKDMLGRLASFLGIHGGEEEILELRSRLTKSDYVNMLFDDASIGCFIIDDGFNSQKMLSIGRFADLSERPVFHCARIESVLEKCLAAAQSFEQLEQSFQKDLECESGTRKVALKTIAAYRGGLEIDVVSRAEAKSDFESAKKTFTEGGARLKISRRPLYHYFLLQAFKFAGKKQLPVQVHCGLGDQDADLRQANPLCFRSILESEQFAKADFVFLHCFPYVKEAALLASVYGNVYVDISLAPTLASPLTSAMFFEALSIAPSTKVLAATDGHSVPESYWYAARSIKKGLAEALRLMLESGYSTQEQLMDCASLVLHGNARRLYRLEGIK